jgi:hypothetical protein
MRKPVRTALIALFFCAAGCAPSATGTANPEACQSSQGVSCHDPAGHVGGSGQDGGQGNGGGMNHGMM